MCQGDFVERRLSALKEQLCEAEFCVARFAFYFEDRGSAWVSDRERLPVFCVEGYVNTQIVVCGVILEEDLRDLEPISSHSRASDPHNREQPGQENRQLAYVPGHCKTLSIVKRFRLLSEVI